MPGTTTGALALRYDLPTDPPDGPGALSRLAADVDDRLGRTAAAVGSLAAGTRYGQRAVVGTVEYRWNGTVWQPWDSEWIAWNPSNANASYATTAGLIRYRNGEAAAEFAGVVNGQGNGQVTLGIPSAFQAYGAAQPKGTLQLVKPDATAYLLYGTLVGTTMYLGYVPAGSAAQTGTNGTATPIAWLGNTLKLSLSWAIQ